MNLAVVVEGQPGSLKYLKNTTQEICDVLNRYASYTVEFLNLQGVDLLTTQLENFGKNNKNIENFIFYYVGHGKKNFEDRRDNRFEFEITNTHAISLQDLLIKIREFISPKKIFIIVDACYSGKITEDLHTSEVQNVYLLSSCSKTQLSYEDDRFQSTRYSHFFCKALREGKGSTLKDIEDFVIKNLAEQVVPDQEQTPKVYDPHELKTTKVIEDIHQPYPSGEEDLFVTIELKEVDASNFKFWVWIESENGEYSSLDTVEDGSQTLEEIVISVDNFLSGDSRFTKISSDRIFLLFVLPKRLIKSGLCEYRTQDDFVFSKKYTILLRSQERFRNNKFTSYRLPDWQANWNNYNNKLNESTCNVYNYINDTSSCQISSRAFRKKPLVILGFEPDEEAFENLYKSATPVALWTKGCSNFNQFKSFIESSKKQLRKLHKELFELQPDYTQLDANILMLCDDPEKLPLDEEAPLLQIPQ